MKGSTLLGILAILLWSSTIGVSRSISQALGAYSAWSAPTAAKVIYMAVGPAWLAHSFWDVSARRGQIVWLTSLSYFTPLLSTLISVLILRAAPPPGLWLAALLVMAGAVMTQRGLR